jgi:hypothetical protein
VEKSSDGWYKVEYNGKTGYVSRELIGNNEEQNSPNERQSAAKQAPARDDSQASQRAGQTGRQNGSDNKGTRNGRGDNQRAANKQNQKGSAKAGSGSSRNWGVGLRLGEPAGLTVKKYLSGNHALEVSLGRAARWGYHYNEDDFYKLDDFRDRENYHYAGFKGGFSTALQVHYLWQKPVAGAKGLEWYLGAGAQARFTPYRYYYYYNDGSRDNDWRRWHYVEERRTDVDLGIDGVIGLEYTLPSAPLSLFADVNLFLEIVDAPFFAAGQGGAGIRYNF